MRTGRETAVRILTTMVVLATLAAGPPAASAATAPTLVSPDAAASYAEGKTVVFSWTGSLQGDADALDRSSFRVEIAPAESVPSDAQAQWTTLANWVPTTAGEAVTQVEMGVPEPGSYKWRVCAYGVVDDSVNTQIVQLPSGCSSSRALTSAAASANSGARVGSVTMDGERRVQRGADTVVTQETPQTTVTLPAENIVKKLPLKEDQKVKTEEDKVAAAFGKNGNPSSLALPTGGRPAALGDDPGRDAGGTFGFMRTRLSASTPFIPVPYWSLALLLVAIPLCRLWRRSVVGMFGDEDDAAHEDADWDDLESLKIEESGADAPPDLTVPAEEHLVA